MTSGVATLEDSLDSKIIRCCQLLGSQRYTETMYPHAVRQFIGALNSSVGKLPSGKATIFVHEDSIELINLRRPILNSEVWHFVSIVKSVDNENCYVVGMRVSDREIKSDEVSGDLTYVPLDTFLAEIGEMDAVSYFDSKHSMDTDARNDIVLSEWTRPKLDVFAPKG